MTHQPFNTTHQDVQQTFSELGSLILNSPSSKGKDSSKPKVMKIYTGMTTYTKTEPSIPYNKSEVDNSLSPTKYYPKHDFIHK